MLCIVAQGFHELMNIGTLMFKSLVSVRFVNDFESLSSSPRMLFLNKCNASLLNNTINWLFYDPILAFNKPLTMTFASINSQFAAY